jgi:subtilisin family serine protease
VEALEALPEVHKIWPVIKIEYPTPIGFDKKQNVKKTSDPKHGFSTNVIRGKDYKVDYNLKMAGIHHLHSQKIKGKGIKVAIIDSGVDYNHPALGGKFGPGQKIAFGRNYVDDGQGGPDDPISTCIDGGHGTHVAGRFPWLYHSNLSLTA